jgi:hypothetical protein
MGIAEKKAQEQQWATLPTRSPSHSRSSSIGDIPPEILPWLAKICPNSGLPIPPTVQTPPEHPPPIAFSNPVRSHSFSNVTSAAAAQAQAQPRSRPMTQSSHGHTHGIEKLGFGSRNFDVGLDTSQPSHSQCPRCQMPLFLGDINMCACMTAAEAYTGAIIQSQMPGHNKRPQDSLSGYHNGMVWTTEDIQLLERINDQPRLDGTPLQVDPPPMSTSMEEASLLSSFNPSHHYDFPSRIDQPKILKQAQTRGSSIDYTMTGNASSAESSTSSISQPLSNTKETAPRPLLHVATENGHVTIIQMLISHHVDVNEADSDGITAMHLAVKNRHLGAVRLLLQHGADVNLQDNDGQTPLYLAVSLGLEEAVGLFLSRGINSRTKDQGVLGRGLLV